jgi:hypothetical protein
MVYQGTVQNGVVVFATGIPLPDGTAVNVAPVQSRTIVDTISEEIDPVFCMGELAEDAGIPDLSVNADHYLYGHPKVSDGQQRISRYEWLACSAAFKGRQPRAGGACLA